MKSTITRLTILIILTIPLTTAAQELPSLEIGTYLGLEHEVRDFFEEPIWTIQVPTGTVYFSSFPSDNVFVELEMQLSLSSRGDNSYSSLLLLGWWDYAINGVSSNSFYLGAAPALQRASYDGTSNTQWCAAARIGYRTVVRDAIAVHLEAGVRRWMKDHNSDNFNEFMARVGIGGLLKRTG